MNSNLLPGIDSSISALSAERTRMDVIAENIANAQTTRTPGGDPYRRKQVVFETLLDQADKTGQKVAANIVEDPTPFQSIYQPGHPHADKNGMVMMPNVNTLVEMVDLAAASRAFEANLQTITQARSMFQSCLGILRK